GEQGIKDSQRMADLTGELLGIEGSDVLVGSTGVIGVFMPMEKVEKGIRKAVEALSYDGDHNAAQAIMTTDLASKELAIEIEIKGNPVRIGGIAKGSGMIHPNMATML
ncbi:MAG TPA: ornithine acetyltransferase, partial [Syntrophomonas wolfei]|nr:ornithine acetyltransferase [Syntrophomonas wolfei]